MGSAFMPDTSRLSVNMKLRPPKERGDPEGGVKPPRVQRGRSAGMKASATREKREPSPATAGAGWQKELWRVVIPMTWAR